MYKTLLALLLVLLVQSGFAQDLAAPAFTLEDSAGEQLTLPREHKGADIYFFWASWCPYCKALMPHLQSMRIEYGNDVTIYALNVRDEEMPELFMLEHDYDFTLVPEADAVMDLYGVQGVPALFVVDGRGMIRFNLYDMIFSDSSEFKALGHGKKAGRRAPHWAAAIRKSIDRALAEQKAD